MNYETLPVHLCPIENIKVEGNRQRKFFDKEQLKDLKESIKERRLIKPLIVNMTEDQSLWLVAGQRRLLAIQSLESDYRYGNQWLSSSMVPVVILNDLTEIQAKEIELEENITRQNITWQEKVSAEAELHKLRSQQAEERGEKQTLVKTSEEIYGEGTTNAGQVRESLLLAENLDDLEISSAKTKREAMKLLTKKNEEALMQELAERQGDKAIQSLTFEQRDCLEALSEIEDKFVCIIADPPYNVGATAFRNYNSPRKHEYEDFDFNLELFLSAAYRACQENAHMYLWCGAGWETLATAAKAAVEAEWSVWKWPMIWNKTHHTLVPDQYRGPARQYETLLFLTKGDLKVNEIRSDVLTFPGDRDKVHAAQKPVALTRELFARSCVSGDQVCVPFAGSGNEVIAALFEKLYVTAYELDEAHYTKANRLIKDSIGGSDE